MGETEWEIFAHAAWFPPPPQPPPPPEREIGLDLWTYSFQFFGEKMHRRN